MPAAFKIPEQNFQIGIVRKNSPVRMSAHGRVIFEELHKDIRNIVYLVEIHKRLRKQIYIIHYLI